MSVKINVGCGMTPTRGWHNFDNSWSIRLACKPIAVSMLRVLGILKPTQLKYVDFAKKNKIYWADASRRLPLSNNFVDVLYSSHMLEHLDRQKTLSFLNEAKRILKPGGIIRIAVPDLRLFIDDYIKDKDADKFITKLHMNMDMPSSLIDKLKYLFVGSRQHQWNYDADSLSNLLRKSGFENPTFLEPGTTTIPNPGALDLYARAEESLYIEATNP